MMAPLKDFPGGAMAGQRAHLVVGTPAYGGSVTSLYATSLLKLQRACHLQGDVDLTVWMPWGDALIPRARQDLVARFLQTASATHLLFVDADIGFEPEQVFRFLSFGADMTAGVYPLKRLDWKRVMSLAAEGKRPMETAALSYMMELVDPHRIEARGGFARARHAGAGFLMVKRDALEKMVHHYPELKYRHNLQAEDPLKDNPWRSALFNCMVDSATGNFLSEDFSFCRRWTDMGGEIWADLESRLTHVGTLALQGDASTQFGPAHRPERTK
jgi:hypothetical protein